MRKRVAAVAVTALILLAMTGRAEAFDIGYDAGPDGFVLSYTRFPLLGSGKLELADPQDPAQDLRFRFIILPFVKLSLSIKSMEPDALSPQLTLHYVLSTWLLPKAELDGDITLPFGHAALSNKNSYIGVHPDWEMEGVLNVGRRTSSYVLDFGLWNLNGIWKAETTTYTPSIQQTISRSNGDKFVDIRLGFDPRLSTNKITFLITITPHQPATKDDTFVLAGTLPVPYGTYHFYYYRD
jgi:hypothetical protein